MICRFCKADFIRLNRDGFCRKCGPIIRKSIRSARQSNRVRARFVGPPTFTEYCDSVRKATRLAMSKALTAGRLRRLRDHPVPCVDCGDVATVWEHRDYTQPLAVEPTCALCNRRRGIGYPHPKLGLVATQSA